MKYLRLFEDFIKNEETDGPVELKKKPINVKVDEADDEMQDDEEESKPSPAHLKKKPTTSKKASEEEEEIEEDDDFPGREEIHDDDPEIIKEFKAHLNKIQKRRRK